MLKSTTGLSELSRYAESASILIRPQARQSTMNALSKPAMLRKNSMSDELLLALLDGPFKQVRDDNHVDPHSILVYDRSREPLIDAVEILVVLARYPCQGVNSQWNTNDVVGILQEKHNQYRKSMASHEISDEETSMTPACGTVVLIINQNQNQPHRWVGISALIEAGQ